MNVDIKGTLLSLNSYACQILNIIEREALGTSLALAFPEPERQKLHDLIAQCVAPAMRHAPEVLDVSVAVGTVRYVEVIASSLVDRSGQLGATIIMQDITDRVRADQQRCKAEEALKVSERRYRELVQTMSEALALTDDQHIITYVNQSFCDMFGYTSKEVVGRPLLDFVDESDKEMMQKRMSKPLQNESAMRFETLWMTKDGRKVTTLTSPKRLFDTDSGYIGCLGIFTDITERKQAEKREKQHMLELAHVSRVTTMDEMSSQIAHELAQPLTAIASLSVGCLKLFKAGGAAHEDIEEALTDISQQANRARDIVVRLRSFVGRKVLICTWASW